MLLLNITARGESRVDLAVGLEEIMVSLKLGYKTGSNGNDERDYHFELINADAKASSDYSLHIPTNDLKFPAGDYSINEIVEILRTNKNNPALVQFIADMMEE